MRFQAILRLEISYAVVNVLAATTVAFLGVRSLALVGSSRLELPTSRLSGVCSNQLSYEPAFTGGDDRVRTGDLLLARQALYQLSYTPKKGACLIDSFIIITFSKTKVNTIFAFFANFFKKIRRPEKRRF